jgi:hypothetical protein
MDQIPHPQGEGYAEALFARGYGLSY